MLAAVRSWSVGTRPRPVVFSSPYPAEECLQRLSQATTERTPTSWYLDARTAALSRPRFWGEVSSSGISIVEFEGASRRASYAPRLCVRLEPAAAGGGTTLTGTIGMESYSKDVIRVATVGAGLLSTAFIAVGIAILVGGHLTGLLFLLVPLFMVGFFVSLSTRGLPFLAEHITTLIEDANRTLGSTAVLEPSPDRT
jgi:hypothetical protein